MYLGKTKFHQTAQSEEEQMQAIQMGRLQKSLMQYLTIESIEETNITTK